MNSFIQSNISQENSKLWLIPELGNLELLNANYISYSFSRHMHEGFAMGAVSKGVEAFTYRGETCFAPVGSLIVLNPEEVHTGYSASEFGCSYRAMYPDSILFQEAIATHSDSKRKTPYFASPVIYDKYLFRIFNDLHFTLEQSASRLERESKLFKLLASLTLRYGDVSQDLRINRENKAVKLVRDYLEENYQQDTSLQELANLTKFHPSSLVRVFRREIGLPPHAYQTQVRIRRAEALIIAGKAISEIALMVGFADQSHLTRQFKKHVGVTPGQYGFNVNNVQDS